MSTIRDAHIDEHNDAAVESMIADAAEALAGEKTEQKAHEWLGCVIADSQVRELKEKGLVAVLSKNSDLIARLLIKIAKARKESK